MYYKKQTFAQWNERLADLRRAGIRPFGGSSYYDLVQRTSYDLRVLLKHPGVLEPVSTGGLEAKA